MLFRSLAPELDEAAFRAELGVPSEARLVGLLPGSRAGEMRAHARTLLEVGQRLRARFPDVVPVLALARNLTTEGLPAEWLDGVKVVKGRTHSVQAHAACCAVASGTATLETALLGSPLAIVYRVGWINHAIARRVVKLSHIGLPNIVAGREVAPEFIQGAFRADAVADTLGGWLADPTALAERREALRDVRARLGGGGASERTARLLAEVLA
mgnify:FL=1